MHTSLALSLFPNPEPKPVVVVAPKAPAAGATNAPVAGAPNALAAGVDDAFTCPNTPPPPKSPANQGLGLVRGLMSCMQLTFLGLHVASKAVCAQRSCSIDEGRGRGDGHAAAAHVRAAGVASPACSTRALP